MDLIHGPTKPFKPTTPLCCFPPTLALRSRVLLHGVQTLLHLVQVTLGYMLMLCVMSYNVWIFLGVVLGSALGYFIAFPLLRDV